jgi:hypothetical protein
MKIHVCKSAAFAGMKQFCFIQWYLLEVGMAPRSARPQGRCCSGYSMTFEFMGPGGIYQIMGIDLTGAQVSRLQCGDEMSKPLECKRVVWTCKVIIASLSPLGDQCERGCIALPRNWRSKCVVLNICKSSRAFPFLFSLEFTHAKPHPSRWRKSLGVTAARIDYPNY